MRRRSGMGKSSQCMATTKQEPKNLKVASRPRKTDINKTKCVATGESKKPRKDGLCEDGLLIAKGFVIPLAERVKLRRMSSSMAFGGVVSRKPSNASGAVVSRKLSRAPRDKCMKTTRKAVRILSGDKHVRKQNAISGSAVKSSSALVATKKAARALSGRLASYKANIRISLQATCDAHLSKLNDKIPVEKIERKKHGSSTVNCGGNSSSTTFNRTGKKSTARQRHNVAESTIENADRKINSTCRKSKTVVRRPLEYRRRQSEGTEEIECARVDLIEKMEGKQLLMAADETFDDGESENMPILSMAYVDATTSDADDIPAQDCNDAEAMPCLEPLSTSESFGEICLPQVAAGVKRAPADDNSGVKESKLVKREPVSFADKEIEVPLGKNQMRRETDQLHHSVTECSRGRKSRARKRCPVNIGLPSTHGDVSQSDGFSDISSTNASVDNLRCTLQSKVNPATYLVASARTNTPAGIEHFVQSGMPVAPLVVGWYPMVGPSLPNSFRPQQLLPAAGSVAVLPPPGGFGLMLPAQSVASPPPAFVCSRAAVPSGSAESGAAARQVFWPPPFIRPVMPQACGSLLAPNLVQPMMALPGNRTSMMLDAVGPGLTPGGINCSPVYPTQMMNIQPSVGSSFFTATNL